jgi:hypothetical protein
MKREVKLVSWTDYPPRFRALARDNRFRPLHWSVAHLSGKLEFGRKAEKLVYRVFVSGSFKLPCTNRGVGHRKDNDYLPCCRCGFPTERAKLSIAFPHGAVICPACYKIVLM